MSDTDARLERLERQLARIEEKQDRILAVLAPGLKPGPVYLVGGDPRNKPTGWVSTLDEPDDLRDVCEEDPVLFPPGES